MNSHCQKGDALPPENELEQRQLRALGDAICSDEHGHEQLMEACEIARKHLVTVRRKARVAKYEHLGAVYKLLCASFANSDLMSGMKRRAEQRGITTAGSTSTALLFIKLLSSKHLEPATASQQAMALRGAALMGIAPNELAVRIPKLGGIAKLAEYFRAQRRPSARKVQKLARKSPLTQPSPELKWSSKVIERWERVSSKSTDVHLILRRTSQSRWTVLAVSRCLTEKGERYGL